MEKDLQNVLASAPSWEKIYTQLVLRNTVEDSSAGKLFEYFCKHYYLTEPTVAADYKNVWLYEEAPRAVKEKLNLATRDHGVDLRTYP